LHPIPFLAEDFGDLSATFMPMFPDSRLDQLKVGLSDGPFPDGNGQHSHCISEQNRRRQQKMHENEKKWAVEYFLSEMVRIFGLK